MKTKLSIEQDCLLDLQRLMVHINVSTANVLLTCATITFNPISRSSVPSSTRQSTALRSSSLSSSCPPLFELFLSAVETFFTQTEKILYGFLT